MVKNKTKETNKQTIKENIQPKNKWWRPAKISQEWIDRAELILLQEKEWEKNQNALIHTDEDLFDMINEWLPKEKQITIDTLKEYKKWRKLKDPIKQALLNEFSHLIKKALRIQRDNLLKSLQNEPVSRQRWAWIIERKFDDRNLRKKIEWDFKNKIDMTITQQEEEEFDKILDDNL